MTLYLHRFSGHTAAGETLMFTWHADSLRTLADASDAAVAWVGALWAGATAGIGFGDHVPTAAGIDGVSTVSLDPATGLQINRLDAVADLPGMSVDNTLPSDVALVVSLRTALARGSGRGRFYLPSPVVTDVDATGRVASGLRGDLNGALLLAWTGYNSASDGPVVYSRTLRATNQVTSWDVGDLWDTQRRRENKLVEHRDSQPMP